MTLRRGYLCSATLVARAHTGTRFVAILLPLGCRFFLARSRPRLCNNIAAYVALILRMRL